MKIHFTLTQRDLLDYNRYLMRSQKFKYRIYITWGLLTAYLIYFLFKEFQRGPDWSTLVIMAFVIGIFYLVARRINRPIERAVKKTIKNNPDSIGARTIEITDNELIYTTPSLESRFKNDSFDRVEITDKLLMIFTGKTQAIVLPKSVVDESKIEQIKELLKMP